MRSKIKASVSDLRSHLGYRMRVVSNAVSHSFARNLAGFGVTVAEWVVLREMYSSDEKISPSKVADVVGLTRGAVSKLVDRLLEKGLVSRAESSGDRRYQNIALTAKAYKLVPKLAGIADENDERFFSALTASERKSLFNILVKLAEFHQINGNPIN